MAVARICTVLKIEIGLSGPSGLSPSHTKITKSGASPTKNGDAPLSFIEACGLVLEPLVVVPHTIVVVFAFAVGGEIVARRSFWDVRRVEQRLFRFERYGSGRGTLICLFHKA